MKWIVIVTIPTAQKMLGWMSLVVDPTKKLVPSAFSY